MIAFIKEYFNTKLHDMQLNLELKKLDVANAKLEFKNVKKHKKQATKIGC